MSNNKIIDWPSEEEKRLTIALQNSYTDGDSNYAYEQGFIEAIGWLSTRHQPDNKSEVERLREQQKTDSRTIAHALKVNGELIAERDGLRDELAEAKEAYTNAQQFLRERAKEIDSFHEQTKYQHDELKSIMRMAEAQRGTSFGFMIAQKAKAVLEKYKQPQK